LIKSPTRFFVNGSGHNNMIIGTSRKLGLDNNRAQPRVFVLTNSGACCLEKRVELRFLLLLPLYCALPHFYSTFMGARKRVKNNCRLLAI
jgi:hypothetical protein